MILVHACSKLYKLRIGFTAFVREKYRYDSVIFSLEFLHKLKVLYNNVYPKASVRKSRAKMTEMFIGNELYAA